MMMSVQRYLIDPSTESSIGTKYSPDPLSFFQEILYLRWVTLPAADAGYERNIP